NWLPNEGQLWRFGSDIYDGWPSVLENYREDNTPGLPARGGPGHWNDADMLEIGNGGMTDLEYQTQFVLWSEMASPLLLSTDLAKLTPAELNIVRNKNVLAVDQDPLGKQGEIVASGKGYDVLSRPLAGGDHAVVLFNSGDTAQTISTTGQTVGAGSNPLALKDLLTGKVTASNGIIAANVPAHGTAIYRVSANPSKHGEPSVVVTATGDPQQSGQPSGQSSGQSSGPVTVTLANNGMSPIDHVEVTLKAPAGWTVTPTSAGLGKIDAGHSGSAKFTVSRPAPPPGKQSSTLTATADFRWQGTNSDTATGQDTVLTNTPYDNLAQAFNNVAITDESNPTAGDFDGGGDSYSAQALAAAGVTPGSTVTHDGVSFAWPSASAGANDNVVAGGQIVKFSGKGSKLAFLGSEAGFASGDVTVTYTDGSTATASLGFPNWCCTDPTAYGAQAAITTDHRDTPSGPANYGVSYIVFYNTIALDPSKTVASVQLPDEPAIHVFALSTAS
ncbi:MAG: hypothetical protein J2O49_06015, partial [Sciscionella sp.]|nr:hypothetical protein [Sciscionella sp.]